MWTITVPCKINGRYFPSGCVIKSPQDVVIGGALRPRAIFTSPAWDNAQRAALGIYMFREVGFDKRYLYSTGYSDSEPVDYLITRTHTTTWRNSLADMKTELIAKIKRVANQTYLDKFSCYAIHKVFDSGYTIPAAIVTKEANHWAAITGYISDANACANRQCLVDLEASINWPSEE